MKDEKDIQLEALRGLLNATETINQINEKIVASLRRQRNKLLEYLEVSLLLKEIPSDQYDEIQKYINEIRSIINTEKSVE